MDKPIVTRRAIRQVLRDYWDQYRKYPAMTVAALLLPACGSIFVFFVPPLIIAHIVNVLAATGTISLSSVGSYIILFAVLWLVGEILWRIGLHILIKLETKGVVALGKLAFHRATERDYDFYTNNFVGSLTKRA
ncbi:MAG: ABC transporter ATP-binding protein, partial [Patescibacteria group bacterium]|nr:ABC transporter ATP-binding protein [Patescibacteria group bacterium]